MRESRSYLCIGGPMDGQVVGIPSHLDQFKIPVKRHEPVVCDQQSNRFPIEYVVYRVTHFSYGQIVAVAEGLDRVQVMERLFSNYVPQSELERRESATVAGLRLRIHKLTEELAQARDNNSRFDQARDEINEAILKACGTSIKQYHRETHNLPTEPPIL